MIYLIDEKKNRQEKYGWSNKEFSMYNDIEIIYDVHTFESVVKLPNFWSTVNRILLHDSFFKNLGISRFDDTKFKEKLMKNEVPFAIFGGSFSSIYISNDEVQLPVSRFYDNLKTFLESEEKDIRILVYGNNLYDKKDYIKYEVWRFLYLFENDYSLSDIEIFELQKKLEFNEKIMNLLEKYKVVSQIKYNISKW